MIKVIKRYNALDGRKRVMRSTLERLKKDAKNVEPTIYNKLSSLLKNNDDAEFSITISKKIKLPKTSATTPKKAPLGLLGADVVKNKKVLRLRKSPPPPKKENVFFTLNSLKKLTEAQLSEKAKKQTVKLAKEYSVLALQHSKIGEELYDQSQLYRELVTDYGEKDESTKEQLKTVSNLEVSRNEISKTIEIQTNQFMKLLGFNYDRANYLLELYTSKSGKQLFFYEIEKFNFIPKKIKTVKKPTKQKVDANGQFGLFGSYVVPKNPTISETLEFADKNLFNTSIYHKDIDKKIKFSKSGIKKAISGKKGTSNRRLQLVFIAKQLLESSRLMKSEKDNRNRKTIIAVHKFRAYHVINDKKCAIFFNVRETTNGTLYYDHDYIETKKRIRRTVEDNEVIKSNPLSEPNTISNNKVTKNKDTNKGLKATTQIKGVVSTDELMNMNFETLNFTGEWAEFLENPARNMQLAFWGKPKNGKTSSACQFANYLTNFGNVLYNFADQGINASTQKIWKLAKLDTNKKASLSSVRTLDELENICKTGQFDFVFIDMINTYIDRFKIKPHEFQDRFMKKYPEISFILLFEVTKSGNFKGDQGWTHLPDVLVTVENYVMEATGRYGIGKYVGWKKGLKDADPKRYEQIYGTDEEQQQETTTVNGLNYVVVD